MKNRHLAYGLAASALACVLSLFLVSVTSAQNQAAKAAAKPTPRAADGHPDLTGFYVNIVAGVPTYNNDSDTEKLLTKTADGSIFFDYAGSEGGSGHPDDGANQKQDPNQPSYKPEYMAKVKALAARMYGGASADDPQMSCKPLGVPRGSLGNMQIVQNHEYIALLYETAPGPVYRIIYLDGRQHPKDLDTSFLGHSIGHWEGDTLVVDVTGLNEETWLGGVTGGAQSFSSIHSDKEHVIERWSRTGDTLNYQAVVEDPVMLTKPWVVNRHTQIAAKDDYIQPQMCNTNDRDHFIVPSEADHFQCNFCIKDEDKIYGEGANAEREKNRTSAPRVAGGE